jgi:hypothetical protein
MIELTDWIGITIPLMLAGVLPHLPYAYACD